MMESRWGSGKASVVAKRVLRRSRSAGELRLHPGLPSASAPRLPASSLRPAPKTSVRPPPLRRPGAAPTAAPPSKRACPAPAPAATKAPNLKRVPLYDYKTRFTELLDKHRPLKEEHLELKRRADEQDLELHDLRAWRDDHADQLQQHQRTIQAYEERIQRLTHDLEHVSSQYEHAREENNHLQDELAFAETELKASTDTLKDVSRRLAECESLNRHQEQTIAKQTEDIEDLQDSTQKLHWERRNLHNKLQDLKGNIRVVFRVRPAISVGRPVADLSFPDACTIELERLESGASKRLAKHDFKFDRVFGPMSSQEDIWEEVSCLIQSALDGYNVCIFAYGQTGSGKTYTMEGTSDSPGVIPRCCTMIFDSIKQLSKSGWSYTVHASFLEIYNEHLFDLLDPGKDPKDLDIRMADTKGSDVYVTNLSEKEVQSAIELLKLAARAQLNRQTAATASNERSSRSHSVARIRLLAKHSARALTLTSRVCLVDLAGSESAKTTTRLKETKNINRSLSELGQVILALQQKQEHVPFRNSKLTRLLEPQLGGAAKALLVAAAAPYEDCCHESLSTLRFATNVGHCSTAAARRNLALAQPTTLQAKDT